MAIEGNTDLQAVLDGLGHGVLIFSSDGSLVLANLAARTIFGTDIAVIRNEAWSAAAMLFNTRQTAPEDLLDAVRERALNDSRPVRFQTYRSGEYLPCWMAAVQGEGGEVYTMITVDTPDWSAMSHLMGLFQREMREAIDATQGHIDLITQTIRTHPQGAPVEQLERRLSGFTRLVSTHMYRVGRLLEMLQRLEDVRTGKLRQIVRERRRKIALDSFFEDYLEGLDEVPLVDPETEAHDHRSRVRLSVPSGLAVNAPPALLVRVLNDLIGNAITYSMKATPVRISAERNGQNIQINVADEGYGIRERERERVFEPFQRARQPQIISEFGYGLSLYLCKQEVGAMNGQLWFESEEGVGATFSFFLPAWVDETAPPLPTADE